MIQKRGKFLYSIANFYNFAIKVIYLLFIKYTVKIPHSIDRLFLFDTPGVWKASSGICLNRRHIVQERKN